MNIPPIENTIALAAKAHRDQIDKIGEPYILPPIRVMLAVRTLAERTVGALHDVLEDTDMTEEDLRKEGYPEAIIKAIVAITKVDGEPYESYLSRVADNPIALTVKIADIGDNLSPVRLYSMTPEKRKYLEAKYRKAMHYLSHFFKPD